VDQENLSENLKGNRKILGGGLNGFPMGSGAVENKLRWPKAKQTGR
jgi:hypothetical protein